jgi:3-methyl-2-oxobutanoate hydroxymethyltransferase
MSASRDARNNGVRKVTVPDLVAMKQRGEKIAALTAYDATFAAIEDAAGLDLILVGDSAGMVVKGEPDTISIDLDEMVFLTRNVSRGVKRALLAADVPFGLVHLGTEAALEGAVRLMKEGRAEAVKIEGAGPALEPIQRLTQLGVPVIGHLGLTPQSVHAFGGYGLRGAGDNEAANIRQDALALQDAGVFAIVLEKIPRELAADITASLRIPTIGIGAGPGCDGQILVAYDMLGFGPKFRFVRRYMEGKELVREAVASYVKDIREGTFPKDSESFEA